MTKRAPSGVSLYGSLVTVAGTCAPSVRSVTLYRRRAVVLFWLRGFPAPVYLDAAPKLQNRLAAALAGAGWTIQTAPNACVERWAAPPPT